MVGLLDWIMVYWIHPFGFAYMYRSTCKGRQIVTERGIISIFLWKTKDLSVFTDWTFHKFEEIFWDDMWSKENLLRFSAKYSKQSCWILPACVRDRSCQNQAWPSAHEDRLCQNQACINMMLMAKCSFHLIGIRILLCKLCYSNHEPLLIKQLYFPILETITHAMNDFMVFVFCFLIKGQRPELYCKGTRTTQS